MQGVMSCLLSSFFLRLSQLSKTTGQDAVFWTGRFLFFSKKIYSTQPSVRAVPKRNYLILTVERPEAPPSALQVTRWRT